MRSRLALGILFAGCTSGGAHFDFASGSEPVDPLPGSGGAESGTSADEGTEGGATSSDPVTTDGDDSSETGGAVSMSSSGAEPGGPPMHGDPAAGVPEFEALFDEIEGWGTGTTGGLGGTVFVVDTLDDAGDRSFRAAIQSPEAHWIVFADGLNGTIQLIEPIEAGSNKTVDARGHAIQIRGGGGTDPFKAIKIYGQTNLVFVNVNFDDELDSWDQDAEGADAITISNSDHIWIHHCTFARWMDGAIDIIHEPTEPGEMPHHISVTWSSFSRTYQALNWTADRISFGHNVCERVRRRCIQMIEGKGHSWNNVVADWNAAAIQTAKDGGQLYSQRNMFVPGSASEVNARVNGGKIHNSKNHAFGNVQFVGGDDAIDEQFENDSKMLARIDECDDGDDGCWSDLRQQIETEAGAH